MTEYEKKGRSPRVLVRAACLFAGLSCLPLVWMVQEGAVFVGYMAGLELEMVLVTFQLAAIPLFAAWYRFGLQRRSTAEAIGEKLSGAIGRLLLLAVCLQFFSSFVLRLEGLLLPAQYETYLELMDTAQMGSLSVPLILYTVLLGPIGEELIFRGVAMDYLQKAAGRFWIANILQALLFGIYHMDVVQGIYTFLLGMVIGYIVRAYGTLFAGMLLHIFINASGYLLMNLELPAPLFLTAEILGGVLAVYLIRKSLS